MFDPCRSDGRAGDRGCGRSSRLRSGTTGGTLVASLFAFVDFFLLFVHPHGDKFDHHVCNAHAALHLMHQFGRTGKDEEHVTPFVEFQETR